MAAPKVAALILAAGKGTRMYSPKPKVLQTLLGEPMLQYVYDALEPVFGADVYTVVGFGADQVEAAFPGRTANFVVQAKQLGTGHALQCGWDALKASGADYCLVINGDTPLITTESIERLNEQAGKADLAFMTIQPEDPAAFGRVVRDDSGKVSAIVEAKDYDVAVYGPASGELNAGIYLLRLDAIEPFLNDLSSENKSGEYYITDLVGMAVEKGLSVEGVQCGADVSLMGINSPYELAISESALRRSIVTKWLKYGVMIHNPETVIIGPGVKLEQGIEIFGHCELYGKTKIAAGAVLNSYTWIKDCEIGAGTEVKQFCHLEDAIAADNCIIGPYARMRPGAVMEDDARMGNFVEMKKSKLGRGAKASHLTYLGDAEIGPGVNIGAGTITCNYDGKNKFKTTVCEGAFIGSNTALVAPVTIGKNSLIAAGSTITKNVPDESTGIGRARQENLDRSLKKS